MNKEIINLGNGLEIHFCLDAADTGGQFTMFKVVIHPDAKVPAPHYHNKFDETLYCLKGMLTITVDGQVMELRPGDSYFIKRGRIHSFTNNSSDVVEILAFAIPGIFTSDYFKDIAGVLNAGGPPDMGKLKEIMLQHGLVPVVSQT